MSTYVQTANPELVRRLVAMKLRRSANQRETIYPLSLMDLCRSYSDHVTLARFFVEIGSKALGHFTSLCLKDASEFALDEEQMRIILEILPRVPPESLCMNEVDTTILRRVKEITPDLVREFEARLKNT